MRLTREKDAARASEAEAKKNIMLANSTIADMVSTIEAICRYSVAIPPKEYEGDRNADYLRMRITRPSPDRFCYADSAPDMASMYRTIDVVALRVYLEKNVDKFQTAVHLYYEAGKHSAYMISDEALRSAPKEVLARNIFPEICRVLIDYLR